MEEEERESRERERRKEKKISGVEDRRRRKLKQRGGCGFWVSDEQSNVLPFNWFLFGCMPSAHPFLCLRGIIPFIFDFR